MKRFYFFLLMILCLGWGLEANAQVISTLPWSDDFEGGLTNWVVEGEQVQWTLANGNPSIYLDLHNAHSGAQNVYLYSEDGESSSLLSPVFDLSAENDVLISFWYAMPDWSGDQDELYLYYRKSSSDAWTELWSMQSDVPNWAYAQVHLTDLSSTVQFKFDGYGNYGYGIILDDIMLKETDGYWTDEGNFDTTWYDGNGNYYISNAAQLAGLAYLVNNETDFGQADFTLTADIDLSAHEWVAIGNTSAGYYFNGDFNGNNHTIDYLLSVAQDFSDYYGLFGTVDDGLEIKNLVIGENSVIGSLDVSYVGGVVGYAGAAKITNCVNKATLYGDSEVGGIVGEVVGKLTISNCSNYGTVYSDHEYAGGIIGSNDEVSTITQCVNFGAINGYSRLGGIVGYGYEGVYDHCFNKGTVFAADQIVGGISGEYGYIVNCYNAGEVVGDENVGGIVGYMDSDEPVYNSFNRGVVSANRYVSGVVGYVSDEGVSVVNVYNAEYVNHDSSPYGAIIGYISGDESNCTLLGYFDNGCVIDSYPGNTSMTASDMKDVAFATTLNDNMSQNPTPDIPWATWSVNPIVNGGYPTFDNSDNGRYWISEGNYDINWYNPSATTYNIATAAELAGVAYLCDFVGVPFNGKTIKLTADIDLAGHEWVAIGNYWGNNFEGDFDGNNHTISNLYSESQDFSDACGLLGNVVDSAAHYVKDLTLDASCEINAADAYYVGGLIGYVETKGFTMTNCKNQAGIVANSYVGGLIGEVYCEADSWIIMSQCENSGAIKTTGYYVGGMLGYCEMNTQIENCINAADIVVTSYCVGGMVGYADDTCKIVNCENNGFIRASDGYVGGMAGEIYDHAIIANCRNTGEVKSDDGMGHFESYVGGIAGYLYYTAEVSNCSNTGAVTGNHEVAGIVGDVEDVAEVSNCTNSGTITGQPGASYAGGIVGYGEEQMKLANCANSGNVMGYYDVGGIIGYLDGELDTVMNCKNTGTVSGYEEVAGIVGYVADYGDSTFSGYPGIYAFILECQNEGEIIAEDEDAAGIVGYGYNVWADKCANMANITGVGYVGGISGYKGSVTNSYNEGDIVSETYDAGGIMSSMSGYASTDTVYRLIGNCYNRGNVTAGEYAAGIVGYVDEFAVVSNCYTTGEVTATTDGGAVVGEVDDENTVMLVALFYNDALANESTYGTAMPAGDMKSNVLLDTLNANANVWNVNNPDKIQFADWEIRNGFNDGYPIFGFSTVSVEEMAEQTGDFRVYPNPATDYVMVVNEKNIRAEIRLYDMFGKQVKAFATTSDELIRVDVSDLANGVYVLRMGNQTAKIVKH